MVKYCPQCGALNQNDAKFCIKCGYQFPQEEQVSQQPPQQIAQSSPQPIQQTAQHSQQKIPTSKPKQKKGNDIDLELVLLLILGIIGIIITFEFFIKLFIVLSILFIIWRIYKINEYWDQELKKSRIEYQEITEKLTQIIDQLSQNKSK